MLPIWPNGFSFRRGDRGFSILDDQGRVAARTHDLISVGGEFTSNRSLARRVIGKGRKTLLACQGPYWLMGPDVRRVQRN